MIESAKRETELTDPVGQRLESAEQRLALYTV